MVRNEFSYRSLHGAARGRRRLFYASVLALLILAADLVSGGVLRDQARAGGAQLWRAVTSVQDSVSGSGALSTKSGLAHENAALRAELATYRERAALYDAALVENQSLRELLRLPGAASGITAAVISSVRSSPYGTFTISAGREDGAEIGDLVLTPGGFLAGRIAEAGERTSMVRAIFASGQEIDASIPNAAFVVEGRGGGNARAALPRGVVIATGTPVMVHAFGSHPIGIVGSVESDPAKADQTVYISLPINIAALDYVLIIPAP